MAGALIWSLILALASCGIVVAAVHTFRRYRAGLRLQASGTETTGQCTSLSWRQDDVSVRFSYALPDGTEYEADSFPLARTSVTPGSTVSVVYDPASPTTAELTECLERAVRSRRRTLLAITPLLVMFAALDAWTALALFV
ncbi:DUF3592 domain-containing protein [Streptomyces phyllanthi]|uniref:DUF3592 domain-containing protein n=1 Tax=Streptomyces phyllanthi TaxID=1803180 RepID=A0A5N8WH36_9ACTN|nr:DUF3592 domain-containing protein [Streptomyces phyllanthi]MPY46770.1 hypothetical protein [Streptomyces phyllanthi]